MISAIKRRFLDMEMQDRLGWIWLCLFFLFCLAVAAGIFVPKWMKEAEEKKKAAEEATEPSSRLAEPPFRITGLG